MTAQFETSAYPETGEAFATDRPGLWLRGRLLAARLRSRPERTREGVVVLRRDGSELVMFELRVLGASGYVDIVEAWDEDAVAACLGPEYRDYVGHAVELPVRSRYGRLRLRSVDDGAESAA